MLPILGHSPLCKEALCVKALVADLSPHLHNLLDRKSAIRCKVSPLQGSSRLAILLFEETNPSPFAICLLSQEKADTKPLASFSTEMIQRLCNPSIPIPKVLARANVHKSLTISGSLLEVIEYCEGEHLQARNEEEVQNLLSKHADIVIDLHKTEAPAFGRCFDLANSSIQHSSEEYLASYCEEFERNLVAASTERPHELAAALRSRLQCDSFKEFQSPRLVHGDLLAHPGNSLFRKDGSLAAVLDWEHAHGGLGAPEEIGSALYVLTRNGCSLREAILLLNDPLILISKSIGLESGQLLACSLPFMYGSIAYRLTRWQEMPSLSFTQKQFQKRCTELLTTLTEGSSLSLQAA